jgi:hypothetical protein
VDQVGQTPGRVGPGAGPTPWPAGRGLRRFDPSHGCHESTRGDGRVGGDRSSRPVGHVAWPPSLHLAPNRPLQVGGGPIHRYKYPLVVKVDTPHSMCSSPLVCSLVVVAQAKPCWELRVESSLRSSSESSLGDR